MAIRFDDRVAIVTGGGNGLGREYCLQLAELGAKVVVNDLKATDGSAKDAAMTVVEEIQRTGGEAMASHADITDMAQVQKMVAETEASWGRVDILINNAGILRDKTFAKMPLEDVQSVLDVHLMGSLHCTKAVWETMRSQGFGRILFTSSGSGLFGNFGQANYGAAKAAMVGLMNVLSIEGAKYDIRVNTLAPTAATRMLEGLVSDKVGALIAPGLVAPGALYLVSDEAPSRVILGAGAGVFSTIRIEETPGVFLGGEAATVDDVASRWSEITDPEGQSQIKDAFSQTNKFVANAAKALGVDID